MDGAATPQDGRWEAAVGHARAGVFLAAFLDAGAERAFRLAQLVAQDADDVLDVGQPHIEFTGDGARQLSPPGHALDLRLSGAY